MKLVKALILVIALFAINNCTAQSSTTPKPALNPKPPEQSPKTQILDVMQSYLQISTSSIKPPLNEEKVKTATAKHQEGSHDDQSELAKSKGTHRNKSSPRIPKSLRLIKYPSVRRRILKKRETPINNNSIDIGPLGQEILAQGENDTSKMKRGILGDSSIISVFTGRASLTGTGEIQGRSLSAGPVGKKKLRKKARLKKGGKDLNEEGTTTERLPYIEPKPLVDVTNCSLITPDSNWQDQIPIRPCHYTTHDHPRQQHRRRLEDNPNREHAEADVESFHHLAVFNIKHDLDFQEYGEPCSVQLQEEFMITGGEYLGDIAPVDLELLSFNRIWYKRLCSFFSFLECVPKWQVPTTGKPSGGGKPTGGPTTDVPWRRVEKDSNRTEPKKDNRRRRNDDEEEDEEYDEDDYEDEEDEDMGRGLGDADDDDNKTGPNFHIVPNNNDRPLHTDSGRDTTGLLRLKIGGRGPGKARHKSGPGGGRLDYRTMKGMSQMLNENKFVHDGICVCSSFNPRFPFRKRSRYGMDFVQDEARPRWCVAAPGQLCGRVYFKRDIWPGQRHYEFSDHIGCPKRFQGDEYECVRWTRDKTVTTNRTHFPDVLTSTCEKKIVDPAAEKARLLRKEKDKKKKKKRSDASVCRAGYYFWLLLIVTLQKVVLE